MTEMATGMFRYHGRSMWPCFQDGDLLEFEPCVLAEVRVGDCVAYADGDGKRIAHRVAAKCDVLTTRGDALPEVDDTAVSADRLVGRIIRRHRLGQASRVSGGLAGRLAGRFFCYAGRLDPQRDAFGGKVARALRKISMVVLKGFWKMGREEKLTNGDGREVVFWMLGSRAIGKRGNGREWRIAWPWSILVAVEEDR